MVIDREGKIRGMYDAYRLSQLEKLRVLLLRCLEESGPAAGAETVEESQQERSAA